MSVHTENCPPCSPITEEDELSGGNESSVCSAVTDKKIYWRLIWRTTMSSISPNFSPSAARKSSKFNKTENESRTTSVLVYKRQPTGLSVISYHTLPYHRLLVQRPCNLTRRARCSFQKEAKFLHNIMLHNNNVAQHQGGYRRYLGGYRR